ncbi:MAG: hypothetical protein JW390_60074 [Nitrosopumilus sp.]|nr:hypothetical protein [Candidatus Nitrosopumilus limneticus]
MKIHKVTNIEQFVAKILPKQPQKNKSVVESILKNVQKNGDSAVKKYEKKFTGANLLHYVFLIQRLKMHILKFQKIKF